MENSVDLFDAYFKRADLDGNGQISGAEAVAFFQGSGLPKQVLAQVWMHADHTKAGYLGRQEFYNALKLVTVAQSKRELTPDIVKAALFGPASAKIPAPQINLAATPAPQVGAPAPRSIGSVSVASQNIGTRPPQVPASTSSNQPYFPPPQNQFARPLQSMPPSPASHPQQVMPKAATIAAPLPTSSSILTDQLGGGTVGPTSQISSRGVSPPASMTASGFSAPAQPRPQTTTGHTPSTPLEHQDAAITSNQLASKDSNTKTVSGNGFESVSLFGDVFSANPAQTKPNSSSSTSSASSLPVSSAVVPSSSGSQPSVKPGLLDSLQSPISQQHVGGQTTGRPNQQVATQNSSPSTGFRVGAANLASSQSQSPWPRMTQSDIQKYVKVFMQVDTDKDGKISGEQARNLFLSWRLPREVLKQVWDLSDQDNDSMLSLKEFCIALYLMERYREGRLLPATLPNTIISDQTLLSVTSHPTAPHGSGTWGPGSGMQQPPHMTATRPTSAAALRPPRPPPVPHVEEKQSTQQKPKVPVLEKHLVDQLSQEEQDSLNSKFLEAEQADNKVEVLEKEILDSRQKIEFYRAKMQELILYKSRCDNRLNEVTARVSNDKHEVEALAKKYEEKYKQVGDVASKLTIEEATFRDIQERKMELYRSIVKMVEGGTADGVLKERAEHIQSSLEELVKTVNERCKQYGLRSKPTSLVELPFGWQAGIQEGAADWDEEWDKFEDEGFTFVKELTLDVENVLAPPKPKSSLAQKEKTSSNAEARAEKVSISSEATAEKESVHDQSENGAAQSPPDSPGESATKTQSHEFQDSPFRESNGADGSPHAKEIKSDTGGSDSVFSGDKSHDEHGWGTFDTHDDAESVWGFDSVSSKDMDHERRSESSLFSAGEFGLNPIRIGPSRVDDTVQGKSPFVFADSVPSTPAYNQGKSSFTFDSVPSTPSYNQGKSSFAFADSVPSTPGYSLGKSPLTFADSIPSTPAYNFGNSPRRFREGSEDQSFNNFSRFDSFSMNEGGLFQSPSLARFDSIRSTRDSDQSYGFPSSFDSFRESGNYDQSHGLSRFDSFGESDQTRGFSRFDSFRDSDPTHGFPSRFDSFSDSDPSHGFPSRFDSFRECRDSDHSLGFSRFDSFGTHDGQSSQPHGGSLARFDSVRQSGDSDNSHGFHTFDDTDPFGSGGPFKTSLESETPRRTSDDWRAF